MAKFVFDGVVDFGDGSRLPLDKRLKKKLYNVRVALTRDKKGELSSARCAGGALK